MVAEAAVVVVSNNGGQSSQLQVRKKSAGLICNGAAVRLTCQDFAQVALTRAIDIQVTILFPFMI